MRLGALLGHIEMFIVIGLSCARLAMQNQCTTLKETEKDTEKTNQFQTNAHKKMEG